MSNKYYGSRDRADKCLLDLQMACYHAVHDYKGGAAAIAAMSGAVPQVLINKLNPNIKSHTVNVRDLQTICEITQDERLLQTMCSYFNAGYFILPELAEIEHDTLVKQCARVNKDLGSLMQVVSQSITEARVNPHEVAELDKKLLELITAAKTLVEHAKITGVQNGK